MGSRAALRILAGCSPLVLLAFACGGGPVQPAQVVAPTCDANLWSHVYDPARLQVRDACRTVTGVVTAQHTSGDGDVNSELSPDPDFRDLLNEANMSKLGGNLHIEEVCQGKITRDAFDSCRGFAGNVLVPPVGAHVRVTGSYVRDSNHGWMEIHPASEITVIP